MRHEISLNIFKAIYFFNRIRNALSHESIQIRSCIVVMVLQNSSSVIYTSVLFADDPSSEKDLCLLDYLAQGVMSVTEGGG